MDDRILFEKNGKIAVLTFNQPEKRNPFDEEILQAIDARLDFVRNDGDTDVLIITGRGPAFCAGADISVLKGVSDEKERQRIYGPVSKPRTILLGRVLDNLTRLQKVTIAAVNGHAMGGGWALSLGCDFTIASDRAEFSFPEVDLGVPANPDATAILATHVGPSLAKEIMLTCRRFRAAELLPLGLVSQVVEPDEVVPAAYRLANAIAKKNSHTVIVSKATVNALYARGRTPQSELTSAAD